MPVLASPANSSLSEAMSAVRSAARADAGPPSPTAASTTPAAPQALARACAEQVMDVVPGVMDALRAAMRLNVGDQLSVPQFRALAFIGRTPGASVGAVAGFLGVTMPTASAMVDRLVRAGAVQHAADPADRRRHQLHLTGTGRAQLQAIRRQARDDFARTLADRDPEELRTLQAGLHLLHQVFGSG